MGDHIPDVGEIVWLHFDLRAGEERAKRRPALVLSPARYNDLRGMMLCCPMTSRINGYPFEVVESADPPRAVLADQVISLDWRARDAVSKDRVSANTLAEVQAKLKTLLGL